jgi:imidazolonepropionase-like amidohydrolase
MKKTGLFLVLSFLVVLLGACSADATPQVPVVAIVNGTLIDGTGAEPIPDAVLLLSGERIQAVGRSGAVKVPKGAQVIDARGGTILPGFINAHVHFAYDEANLQAWAQGGVTTVRDEEIISSDTLEKLMADRKAWAADPKFARLVSAGYMMTAPDGYGNLFVGSPEEARAKVNEELDAGVDQIKISMEDGYAGNSGLPKLTGEEIAAIIAAAHERGTKVSGHITQAAYLQILVDAGVDDIAHLAYDPAPDSVWGEMVAKDIYLVPTFTVFRNYGAPSTYLLDNLRAFVQAGGKVALGNDFGGGPGEFEPGIPMYEIEMMGKAGMTPMQIIVAATRNAAHVAGIEEELGTLQTGRIADVIIVEGDPLQDIRALEKVWLVIHNGVTIRSD